LVALQRSIWGAEKRGNKKKILVCTSPFSASWESGAASEKAPECHGFSSVKRGYHIPAAYPESTPPPAFKPRDSSSKNTTTILQEGYKNSKTVFQGKFVL